MTGLRLLKTLSLAAALMFPAALAHAQAGAAAPAPTATEQRAPEGPEALVLQDRAGERPAPLGAELFTGAVPAAGSRTVDPNYVLQVGDTVQVNLWGLVEGAYDLTLDPQGNIVVPGMGPVRLQGVTAGEAPAVVQQASRQVFSDGVQVYAAAIGTATTRVLVTGPVLRPGAVAGSSDDALVVFLQRAGGVDPVRGSYRRIRVVRGGETVARADLYDFLIDGTSPSISFRNGDAVVVEAQGPIVSVSGQARAPFTYELENLTGTGAEIMRFARPQPGVTHVAVVGIRNQQPISAYLTLAEFESYVLMDGDRVQFEADARPDTVFVRVEGAHGGPSVFTYPRGATVGQVLSQVGVDADADMSAIHLRRESVRRTQRQMIEEGLDRLERAVYLAPARSPSEAQARAASISFVNNYIERARQVEPLGVLALSGQDINGVRLETGDVIVIPRVSQVVTVAGEVNAPQSVLAVGPASVSSYVRASGGFTSRADRRNVLVFRQDGQIRPGGQVYPGDRILVVGKPDSTLLPFIRDLTQTLFQMSGIFLAYDNVRN